jgi:signal transduction histidine kinase
VAESTAQVLVVPLDDPVLQRIGAESRSGLYARLTARQELVGLVAVERRTTAPFSNHDVAVLSEFSQQMAIGIDNARWFSRIGTLAAEQERSRIARDLHDRVGQSLALVGFELDRASKQGGDAEVRQKLLDLRENVRAVVTELRETLYDLRTDVSDERDITVAMTDFLDLLRARGDPTAGGERRTGGVAHRPGGDLQRRAARRRQDREGRLEVRRGLRRAHGNRRRTGHAGVG